MVSAKTESKGSGSKTMVSGGNRRFWLLIENWSGRVETPRIFLEKEEAKKTYAKIEGDYINSEVTVYECGVDATGAEVREVPKDWYPDVPKER